MTHPAVRVGLVGCGRLAELGYIPAFTHVAPAVELVGVADPDHTRRAHVSALAAAAGMSVAAFPSVHELVADSAVDAVVVASPVHAHLEDAHAAATAGLAVLVEKPPAPDAASAAQLAAITPPPWVGFNRRFDPGAARVRASTQHHGDIELVLELAYRRRSWSAHSVHDDALLDLGPHLVDWAEWISDRHVIAVSDAAFDTDRACCTLTLRRGRARIVARCDRPYREVIDVRDAHGVALARHTQGGLVTGIRSRFTRRPHPLVATLTGQLEAFGRAVRDQDAGVLADARDAARVMAVLDAARVSAASGGGLISVSSFLDV